MTNKLLIRNAAWAALFFASTGFFSCKKDKAEPQTPAPAAVLQEYKSADEEIKFEYDAAAQLNKVIVKADDNGQPLQTVYTVKYLPNKKIDELTGNTGTKIKLLYTDNKLQKAETYEANTKTSVVEYEYLNGLLKSAVFKLVDGNTARPFQKQSYTYSSAGNIVRIDNWELDYNTQQLVPAGYVTREYDNKPNPFATVNDIMMILWQASSKNNAIKETRFSTTNQQTEQTTFTYTYNAKQYPISAQVRTQVPGEQPVTATIFYGYK